MKTFILIVISFITSLLAQSQEAFVMGKTYPISWVVWYPYNAPDNIFKSISVKPFVAKTTPDKDPANWERVNNGPTSTPGTVKQASFDSLLTQLKLSQAKQSLVEAKANLLDAAVNALTINIKDLQRPIGLVDSLSKDVSALKSGTLRVTQTGIPLIVIAPDGTLQMRSIRVAPTSGLDAKVVNGEIVIDKK